MSEPLEVMPRSCPLVGKVAVTAPVPALSTKTLPPWSVESRATVEPSLLTTALLMMPGLVSSVTCQFCAPVVAL